MSGLLRSAWHKSSYCANNSCVEVAFLDGRVAVRDSKDPDGPLLFFTQEEWASFLQGARNGEFELTFSKAIRT